MSRTSQSRAAVQLNIAVPNQHVSRVPRKSRNFVISPGTGTLPSIASFIVLHRIANTFHARLLQRDLRILSALSALPEKAHFRFASTSAYLSAYYRTWRYPRTSGLTTGDRTAEKREQAALSAHVALFLLSASLNFLGGLFDGNSPSPFFISSIAARSDKCDHRVINADFSFKAQLYRVIICRIHTCRQTNVVRQIAILNNIKLPANHYPIAESKSRRERSFNPILDRAALIRLRYSQAMPRSS
jgi:hypothetical protein